MIARGWLLSEMPNGNSLALREMRALQMGFLTTLGQGWMELGLNLGRCPGWGVGTSQDLERGELGEDPGPGRGGPEAGRPVSKTVWHLFILTPHSPRKESRTDFWSSSGNVGAFLSPGLTCNTGFHSDWWAFELWLSNSLDFPGRSGVKNLPIQKTWVWSWGGEDPLEKEMATHSSVVAREISWTEEPDGLQSMGLQRVGYDVATKQQHQRQLIGGWPGVGCMTSLSLSFLIWKMGIIMPPCRLILMQFKSKAH